jgi:EmrB/QacA subfamily drug resistance transporter
MSRTQIHDRRWLILGVLILALFGVTLDNMILNIALPTLAVDLDATAAELQWIVNAYILVFAGLLLVAGALSDRFGRRRILVIGLTLFGVGSALAPLVSDATQLIALRAFMGLGAALTMPSTLSIISDVFDEAERPKAIAAWGAVSGLGIVAGPLVGGYLLEHYAWTSVFLVNVPFVILGVVATLAIVPESRAPGHVSLDPAGAVLSVVGLVALVWGIIEIPANGWTSPFVLTAFAVATLTLVTFAWWEQRVAEPMLDVRLFRNPRFTAASLSITLAFFSLMGALFFLTQYLQGVQGLSALETGVRFIPIAIGIIVVSPISAAMTTRFGARIVVSLGLLVTAAGLASMATLGVGSSDLHIAAVLLTVAAGLALAMTPATDAIMGAVPKAKFGVGSAVNDTVREIGGAFGVAVLGSLFAASYSGAMRGVTSVLPTAAADAARESLAAASAIAATIGGPAGALLQSTAQTAFVDAMGMTSLIGAGFAVAGAVLAIVWLPARSATKDAEGPVLQEVGSEAFPVAAPGAEAGA